jgi:hypothetical protein
MTKCAALAAITSPSPSNYHTPPPTLPLPTTTATTHHHCHYPPPLPLPAEPLPPPATTYIRHHQRCHYPLPLPNPINNINIITTITLSSSQTTITHSLPATSWSNRHAHSAVCEYLNVGAHGLLHGLPPLTLQLRSALFSSSRSLLRQYLAALALYASDSLPMKPGGIRGAHQHTGCQHNRGHTHARTSRTPEYSTTASGKYQLPSKISAGTSTTRGPSAAYTNNTVPARVGASRTACHTRTAPAWFSGPRPKPARHCRCDYPSCQTCGPPSRRWRHHHRPSARYRKRHWGVGKGKASGHRCQTHKMRWHDRRASAARITTAPCLAGASTEGGSTALTNGGHVAVGYGIRCITSPLPTSRFYPP